MKYYISDLHLGHKNIINLCKRPFNNITQMDHSLIQNWNNVITNKDEVYILGDFAFSNQGGYLSMLNGKKYLILGNHDKGIEKYSRYFEKIESYKEIDDNGRKIILFHYPLIEWRGSFRGSLHLYGHIHNNTSNKTYEIVKDIENAYNVSADILDFTPQTLEGVINCNKKFKDTFNYPQTIPSWVKNFH